MWDQKRHWNLKLHSRWLKEQRVLDVLALQFDQREYDSDEKKHAWTDKKYWNIDNPLEKGSYSMNWSKKAKRAAK